MEEPEARPATADQAPAETLISPANLVSYFREIVPVLVGGSEGELYQVLSKPESQKLFERFIDDTQATVLAIGRYVKEKEEGGEEQTDEEQPPMFVISLEVGTFSSKYCSVGFVKRGGHIVADKDISSQLRVITLSEGQPFETLHSYVQHIIKAYLNAAVGSQKSGDKIGFRNATRSATDLEMSLLHLQEDIEIPDVNIVVHPVVKQLIAKANEAGRKPTVQDLGDKVEDPQLLNALQKCVAKWVREMQKVTRLDRDPASGTTLQEVSFWLNLEQALYVLRERRDAMDIALTMEILKHGKRFHATVSFDADTGLTKAIEMVQNYNQLMKDFPLSGLLSASDTEAIRVAIIDIFAHLKKLRNTKYPVARANKLIQTLSRDLSTQLLRVLSGQGLMQVSYVEFERFTTGCKKVFATWDEEEDRFRNTLREQMRRFGDEASTRAIRRGAPDHKVLVDRIDELINFRKAHEQLRTVIVRVLRPTAVQGSDKGAMADPADQDAIEEVNLAYEDVKSVDVLDITPAGTQTWENAKRRYEERIDRVENRITTRLRDQLATAKNGSEMFRIFGKFNALFVRPHIRGAIREYQTQLIQRVKADIEALQQKFKVQYPQTHNFRMSEVRDLPPIAGQIIWAKQIERQLVLYLRRVEDVLGRGWEAHVEGRALKEEGEAFKAKLDTSALFEKWSAEAQQRQLTVAGRIFDIDMQRSGGTQKLQLAVNFHSQIITLSKEVRNLKWLGFRVPLVVVNKALQAQHSYPYAISLRASIRSYQQTLEKLSQNPSLAALVANYHKQIQARITEGVTLRWESFRLEAFVQALADEVNVFQEKVDEVLAAGEKVDAAIGQLDTVPYDSAALATVIEGLQKVVDDLNLHSFVNLEAWVAQLDKSVEARLAKRLTQGVQKWALALEEYGKSSSEWDDHTTTDVDDEEVGLPKINQLVHEIQIRSQVMYLNPPAESARERLFLQLQHYMEIITNLPRIQASRFQVGTAATDQLRSARTYRSVLTLIQPGELLKTYRLIEDCFGSVHKYVQVWLQYQALWDLQADSIVARLGDNLQKWNDLLVEIKKARRTFDTSETSKSFGPVVINYAQVQNRVNMKYDALHKEILTQFGTKLGAVINEFYAAVQKARIDLESQTVDTASTTDAVNFMSLLQDYKRKSKKWTEDMTIFAAGQRQLERQRYAFPDRWLYMDNLQGQWDAFLDILHRKDALVQGQVSSLQMKVVEEDRAMDRRISELLGDWDRNKPVQGDVKPDQAVQTIAVFETRFTRLKEEGDALTRAKHALDLDIKSDDRLAVRLEELQDLKGSWTELARIWKLIEELRATQWSQVQPKKLRQSLEDLTTQLKNLPPRVRTYASYEHTFATIKDYIKANPQVTSLKADSLKERHWKTLMKDLGVSWVLTDLTLGQVWAVNLAKNHKLIEDVMLVAQGENALEEFLKQIKEEWTAYQLEMVNYQNKTRLIKGWDDLFTKVREHINSLNAMKLSPYYKVFEEEANSWDDKLNRINALFDVWIDVQRKWVYLEGIFSGSADIKHLLPTESSRFESISSEFMKLMSTVSGAKAGMVMEVLQIPGAQRSLERLADLLAKIQKALGEYLEKERSSFPRFYFVGNEDLLDIIGNSKNVERLQKHFQNMFAGIHSITLNADHTEVVGINSREGEQVQLRTPVKIKEVKINTWLTKLEEEMKQTLAQLLNEAVKELEVFRQQAFSLDSYFAWLDRYQAQLVVLASQVFWSHSVEGALKAVESSGTKSMEPIKAVLDQIDTTLNGLADAVLLHQNPIRRRKLEHMITEMVHQRDVTRELFAHQVASPTDFRWLSVMRFNFNPRETDVLKQLAIEMADAKFYYGFEYLGLIEKLVQTPLTDRCYLTMTQALKARQGGSPFGPAGTGKTESVKSLGNQLGRFVLVFNCDETFDFHSMGRIFVGLCQVGAWGCFDEFNRLEERMLSAVSQQIQSIQISLKEGAGKDGQFSAELLGRSVKINPDMAIFITMNPGYAGRSELPDNLKKLFRNLAMTQPDRQLIAQVMLYSQGFRSAEQLASKVVPLFILCAEQLSAQSHYDFGLRALKAVLVTAGNLKRSALEAARKALLAESETINEEKVAGSIDEQLVLIQSIAQTMIPKLVADDIPLLHSLLLDVFPGVQYVPAPLDELRDMLIEVCKEQHIVPQESFITKMLQLYQVTNINHGLMLVGPSGSGKSTAWKILLEALNRLDKKENKEAKGGQAHVLDPKAIVKDELYGSMDQTTREWTDGLFTHHVRKIIDNVRGELDRRQWIIFDGDVDPEWVENLNSVLDDNKLLTLPNGERLALPKNIRIIFEVQDLKNATLATVSRCGMVWFSEDVVTLDMYFKNFLDRLKNVPLDPNDGARPEGQISPSMEVQRLSAAVLSDELSSNGLVGRCLEFSRTQDHIMTFSVIRALTSLFAMVRKSVHNVIAYNLSHSEFPMSPDQTENYVKRKLLYSIVWSFAGDSKYHARRDLGKFIQKATTIPMPLDSDGDLIDSFVNLPDGQWSAWKNKVPTIELDVHRISGTDVVVPTIDTVRHEDLLYSWLSEHAPMVLCGPPGSGKTMTLFSALRALPDFEVVGLNFSSATTPSLILKTFEQWCEVRRTPNGLVLAPTQLNKWLIVFCDEINLPTADKYSTVRVITFMRQLIEQGGYWRTSDHAWIRLDRIQFVGACNPPTDPGRVPLDLRFLRHVPVVYVDYPGPESLKMIYGTFNRALLRTQPTLRQYAEPLTDSMVDFFTQTAQHFTQDMQPHYVYSPREMTRWVKGISEAIAPLESLDAAGLVRIWAHEALRLFSDRLVYPHERVWTDERVNEVARAHFPSVNIEQALARPILFSNWLTKEYVTVDREQLREFTKARLRVFYEEELDVPLVLFDEVLDHVLRIDRIFRQNQGHLLLIGASGAGKTTLSRFVAWMNGLSVFQVKAHKGYTANDFDEDLRNVLRRSGTRGEKIVFILDEGNVMDTAFLERMNTLLANGEVPGLFEGDEYSALMTACKEGSQREGLVLDGNDELYKWFSRNVMNNLHVVFTMNPSEAGLHDRAATSPALFNRCVLDWFGDWSESALFQVGTEFTNRLDLDDGKYRAPDHFPLAFDKLALPPTHRQAVINAGVFVHKSVQSAARRMLKREGRSTHITPRHFLEFVNQFVRISGEKRANLEDQQLHLNVGLQKIKDTVEQVETLQKSLAEKSALLEVKNAAANKKLQQMVQDQQAAEEKRGASLVLERELQAKSAAAEEKRSFVLNDLAKVEPALKDAREAVGGVKKNTLQELKALANPPLVVKMALESVLVLLGEPATNWNSIRAIIVQDDFLKKVLEFNPETVSPKVREQMEPYLSNPDYNFERADRASKAAGPLVKWAIASTSYATMLLSIEPLRNELKRLETDAQTMKAQVASTQALIIELEKSIAKYKEEYAVLVSDAQAIKTDLATVSSKVERSIKLLDSLSSERGRWAQGSKEFDMQMSTIVGDCLLSAAFVSYAGYFDQSYREGLFKKWRNHLKDAAIAFKNDMSVIEFLSTPDERLLWKQNHLPDDTLCIENAIMITRSIRYPLVIDPSGQAMDFLRRHLADQNLVPTSFVDSAFRKNLESALRFGTPVLVQDAESYDPLLNPVLNREVKRAGGRVLITVGDSDVDLSPSFKIVLTTRKAAVEFAPDICSRATLVNFSITRSSLQTQCLNQVLRSERPDVDKKRSDLLKLQGEFRLRLRQLESNLLSSLNEAKGSILEDDAIISKLENIKREAAEVSHKVAEADSVMQEIETTSKQYAPLAQKCSNIYFALEQMHTIHFLYRYSLQFFLDIFKTALADNPLLASKREYAERLDAITRYLFQATFERCAPGLLNHHRMSFAMTLARFYLEGTPDEIPAQLIGFFMHGSSELQTKTSDFAFLVPKVLSEEQSAAAQALAHEVPSFADLASDVRGSPDFATWMTAAQPEDDIPELGGVATLRTSKTGKAFAEILLLQALRPDRLMVRCGKFIDQVLPDMLKCVREGDSRTLGRAVEKEIDARTPIMLIGERGFDPSGHVRDLYLASNRQCTELALGAEEASEEADKAIQNAAKSGRWVLLKNAHLAIGWLDKLEKTMLKLAPHPQFRLFLTAAINPKLPASLLSHSRVFVYEPAAGIKASLLSTLNRIPDSVFSVAPSERGRVLLLLSWLHAVVQERLRYCPLGWSKKYEFGDSDLLTACDTINSWITTVSQGRAHVSPDKIPWQALRTLLSQTIYGGRIDNDIDQRLLNSFVSTIFTEKSFDGDFAFVPADPASNTQALVAPDGSRREEFLQWVAALPDTHPPTWLGLPPNAEVVLLTTLAKNLSVDMLKLLTIDDDADDPHAHDVADSAAGVQPAWMRSLQQQCMQWLQALPSHLAPLRRTAENIKDPLFRFFEREITVGIRLLGQVRRDLTDVSNACAGTVKQTNAIRSLMTDLVKGVIPKSWRAYKVPDTLTANQWVVDFGQRIAQQSHFSQQALDGHPLRTLRVWLGGLFFSEAYITATRQAVAQANGWSLEKLVMQLDARRDANDAPPSDKMSFLVTGLRIDGASCAGDVLTLSAAPFTIQPLTVLRWAMVDTPRTGMAQLPLYLNATRANTVCMVMLRPAAGISQEDLYKRGVALMGSTLSGMS